VSLDPFPHLCVGVPPPARPRYACDGVTAAALHTHVCVNLTQVCVNLTQVCVNLTQVCVNLTQVLTLRRSAARHARTVASLRAAYVPWGIWKPASSRVELSPSQSPRPIPLPWFSASASVRR
jgi:hypothetical protein